MTGKQPDLSDINALAIEACDMWQEQLSNFSKDPALRAELTRFLEPQRRLFADWAAMMQQGGSHGSTRKEQGADAFAPDSDSSGPPDPSAAGARADAAASAPSGVSAHGDDPFRIAQLALRLAELEKRVAKLESVSGAAR